MVSTHSRFCIEGGPNARLFVNAEGSREEIPTVVVGHAVVGVDAFESRSFSVKVQYYDLSKTLDTSSLYNTFWFVV